MAPAVHRSTWLGSDRLLPRTIARPINRFLHIEASGGLVLVGSCIAAVAATLVLRGGRCVAADGDRGPG